MYIQTHNFIHLSIMSFYTFPVTDKVLRAAENGMNNRIIGVYTLPLIQNAENKSGLYREYHANPRSSSDLRN